MSVGWLTGKTRNHLKCMNCVSILEIHSFIHSFIHSSIHSFITIIHKLLISGEHLVTLFWPGLSGNPRFLQNISWWMIFHSFYQVAASFFWSLPQLLQVATNPKSCNTGVLIHKVHKEWISWTPITLLGGWKRFKLRKLNLRQNWAFSAASCSNLLRST